MTDRKVNKTVRGYPTSDGAGVRLVRVLGDETVVDFDPFLMLDSFDSYDPEDYVAGFPFHPHRGIETITYLISGEVEHKDSLGNVGSLGSGESQWMTAGSGIMHQEMPQPSERMLGVQLWLNLPKEEKMTQPKYFDIRNNMIGEKKMDEATVRVISGEFDGVKGVKPKHIQATIYDVAVNPGRKITLPTKPDENVSIFLILGDGIIDGQQISEKTAVNFGEGDTITVTATAAAPVRFIFLMARPLKEPVAWGGPIVMNTQDELKTAFRELNAGSFIKHKPHLSA